MDGTGIMFEPFLRALSGFETRVVRYPVALMAYSDCVTFARTQLPVDRPFLLLGESFSGPIAIALAAERPASLAGLVLCGTFARNPRPGLAWAASILRALPPMRLPLAIIRLLLLGRWSTEALLELVRSMRLNLPAATLKGRLLAVLAVDHTPLLARIQVPILALCASHDRLVPKEATAWLRAHWADLDIVTLQGPHWLLQTRPEACAQAVQAFVGRNQATGVFHPTPP
jgi:pimeloyl-ACP methyl ester carboxylesterase